MDYDLSIHRFLASMTVPGMGYTFCGVDLKSNEKVVDSSHNINATVAQVAMSCQVSHYNSLQGSHLIKIHDHFSPPILCTEFSNIVKATN